MAGPAILMDLPDFCIFVIHNLTQSHFGFWATKMVHVFIGHDVTQVHIGESFSVCFTRKLNMPGKGRGQERINMRYLKDLQFQHLLCLPKTELTGCINVHYLLVSVYSGIFKIKVIELTVLKSILSPFNHTEILLQN